MPLTGSWAIGYGPVLPPSLSCNVTSSSGTRSALLGERGEGRAQSLGEVGGSGTLLPAGRRGAGLWGFPTLLHCSSQPGAERGGELGRQGMLHCRAEIRSCANGDVPVAERV